MTTNNKNWTFDGLGLELELEKVRAEYMALSAKSQLLHEMIMERYAIKDFDSETVQYLRNKEKNLRAHSDVLHDVTNYLRSLVRGYPFNVRLSVGRYMKKFGLTVEQSELFLNTHRKHMNAMGLEDKNRYSLSQVRNVVWDAAEQCIKVYYLDVWWHYTQKHEWY